MIKDIKHLIYRGIEEAIYCPECAKKIEASLKDTIIGTRSAFLANGLSSGVYQQGPPIPCNCCGTLLHSKKG